MCLIVYVDDIVVMRNYSEEIKQMKTLLASKFEIKDLGELKKFFLGIEVVRSKREFFISQRKYKLDLLKDSRELPTDTPIDPNHKLSEKDGLLLLDASSLLIVFLFVSYASGQSLCQKHCESIYVCS